MIRAVNKLLEPVRRQVRNTIARAVVSLVDDSSALQRVQVQLMALPQPDGSAGAESAAASEVFQHYGFTSVAHDGAEAVQVAVGGVRAHGLVIAIDDRRYRLTGLAEGEVALYDDLGQVVHLTRNGIVIAAPLGWTVNGNGTVNGTLTVSDDVVAGGISLKSHLHGGVQPGSGQSGKPL